MLRNSLVLSNLLKKSFEIINIRKNRPNGGGLNN